MIKCIKDALQVYVLDDLVDLGTSLSYTPGLLQSMGVNWDMIEAATASI